MDYDELNVDKSKFKTSRAIVAFFILAVVLFYCWALFCGVKDDYDQFKKAMDEGHFGKALMYYTKSGFIRGYLTEEETFELFVAAGDVNRAKTLLEKETVDFKEIDKEWNYPHLAASQGHPGMIKFLSDEKFNLNRHDEKGLTPLLLGIMAGSIKVVKVLINQGADVNLPANDRYKSSPLQTAALHGHTDMVELLISKGADINYKAMGDMTALIFATSREFKDTVKVLLENGADYSVKVAFGKTALSLAQEKDQTEIVELLEAAGAKE